jgi:hypothetical protein
MNWSKTTLAGVAGGIALWLANFVLHGLIMGATYEEYEVFRMDGGVFHFLLVAVMMSFFAAVLFGRTRGSWAAGIQGGATFGFYLGLFSFFAHFYNPLTIEGFPYYLSWCWGGIGLIGLTIMGAVVGMVYKEG